MGDHFVESQKARDGNTIQREVLLSILNENNTVLFKNLMNLMIACVPKCPLVDE